MAFETISGIVLKYTNYRDNDRILSLLTRDRGLVSVTARACRKQNSALAAVCEPCCYGEFVVYGRGTVLYVSNATLLESFYPIREDYDKFASAMQIAHMTQMLAYNRLSIEDLFTLCYHALTFIAYGEQNPIDIELCFAVKLLKLAGYEPTLTNCVSCGKDLRRKTDIYFSKAQGGAMCDYCGAGCRSVSALSLEAIRRMLLLPLPDMGKVRLPERVRNELDTVIYDYAEYVFEQTIKLRGR
ncbi:MAG: DNA repair protein RecO [Christensenellaceae bacterium]|nr:DNA repair protein RecO [Christensenellaceae bacterium]